MKQTLKSLSAVALIMAGATFFAACNKADEHAGHDHGAECDHAAEVEINVGEPVANLTTATKQLLKAPVEVEAATETSAPIASLNNRQGLFTPARTFCKKIDNPVVEDKSRPQGKGDVLSGLDVLEADDFAMLKGKKLGLLVNHSAINRDGNHLIDLLLPYKDITMVRMFSPEHGLFGDLDTHVSDFMETRTQLMVHSLYGKRPAGSKHGHPTPEQLKGLDAVIVDMQDIGARFYTYPAFMAYMMEECAPLGIEVIVLDRPNPIGGEYVDGPDQDYDCIGNPTAYFKMPLAHGMTMGELAQLYNKENNINCKLNVVKMKNWKRDMFWDETGLRWVNPSPNIQDLDAAIAYPGIGMTEKIVAMGRGTVEPFHIVGTPYITDMTALIEDVQANMKGVELEPVEFTPTGVLARGHVAENQLCKGVRVKITDRKQFRAVELGLRLCAFLQENYGTKMRTIPNTGQELPIYDIMRIRASLSAVTCAQIRETSTDKKPLQTVLDTVAKQVEEFKKLRAPYLLY